MEIIWKLKGIQVNMHARHEAQTKAQRKMLFQQPRRCEKKTTRQHAQEHRNLRGRLTSRCLALPAAATLADDIRHQGEEVAVNKSTVREIMKLRHEKQFGGEGSMVQLYCFGGWWLVVGEGRGRGR
jgi:hypothetical protein